MAVRCLYRRAHYCWEREARITNPSTCLLYCRPAYCTNQRHASHYIIRMRSSSISSETAQFDILPFSSMCVARTARAEQELSINLARGGGGEARRSVKLKNCARVVRSTWRDRSRGWERNESVDYLYFVGLCTRVRPTRSHNVDDCREGRGESR